MPFGAADQTIRLLPPSIRSSYPLPSSSSTRAKGLTVCHTYRESELSLSTWERPASPALRGRQQARPKTKKEWIQGHVKKERRHQPSPGGRLRKGLGKARKELASRFYASVRPCSNGRACDASRLGFKRQVLVVRQRREANALPPFRQVSALNAENPKNVGEGREGL